MNPHDVRAFLARDWRAVADEKDRFWLEQRVRYGSAWAFEVAEALRQEVLSTRSDWPSADEREADRAVHERVSGALKRVGRNPSR